ncbi:MAG: hypothetical protein QNJ78_09780 [Gammaproteobacteria bacterium]|nr:hypothetical protein [Gammaproteobacteria bacterium]
MAKKPTVIKQKPVSLNLKLHLQQAEGETLPPVLAYVFDRNGGFITSAPLPNEPDGEVKLKLPQELRGTTVRVLVGPPPADDVMEEVPDWLAKLMQQETLSMTAQLRRGAHEKRLGLRSAEVALDMAIQPEEWRAWLACNCSVRGRLIRRLPLPDGSSMELGVCHACVKIYEVDKIPKLIAQLPEDRLFRLRDDLLDYLQKEPYPRPPEELAEPYLVKKWPEPPPPPITKSVGMSRIKVATESMRSLNVESTLPHASSKTTTSLEQLVMVNSTTQLRNALIARTDLVAALACELEWLTYYISSDLIKCTCTDEQGRFETQIQYTCSGDHPDLYFKAVQCIDGSLHTLYDPGVRCHTHWNYVCGTEVLLETDDPAARTCVAPEPVDPPSGVVRWVMPFKVGNISLNRIKSTGLVDYLGVTDAPFGSPEDSRLGFRHGYSQVFPDDTAGQPYYYRWSYRKESSSSWHEYTATVVRHYVEELPGELPTFPAYKLGPYPVAGMHLYQFKPHDPPKPSDPTAPDEATYWPTDEWFGDIYSGFLDTFGLPGGVVASAGRYRIRLEVFDINGVRVIPGGGTFEFIVPDGLKSDGVTWQTRNVLPGEVVDEGFEFTLHIDNQHCAAVIPAPAIGSISASDECGFLRYAPGDLVKISFDAIHATDFAYFHYWMKRGYTNISDVVGEVSATTVSPYTGDGNGHFDEDFSIAALMDTCSEAAFAQNLRVRAKATNGWRRLREYDARDERGFGLAPLST